MYQRCPVRRCSLRYQRCTTAWLSVVYGGMYSSGGRRSVSAPCCTLYTKLYGSTTVYEGTTVHGGTAVCRCTAGVRSSGGCGSVYGRCTAGRVRTVCTEGVQQVYGGQSGRTEGVRQVYGYIGRATPPGGLPRRDYSNTGLGRPVLPPSLRDSPGRRGQLVVMAWVH